jgi:hypothetical protein
MSELFKQRDFIMPASTPFSLYTLTIKPLHDDVLKPLSLMEDVVLILKNVSFTRTSIINETVVCSQVNTIEINNILKILDKEQIRNIAFEIVYKSYIKSERVNIPNK